MEEKKKIFGKRCLGGILLSSSHWLGLMLVCKLQRKVLGVGYPVSWALCCKTWLKFEIAGIKVAIAKKI